MGSNNKTIIHFDIESTGTNVVKDRIVSLCMIKTNINFEILDVKNLLLNPEIPIPKGASDVHGITDEMVKEKFTFFKYSQKVFEFINNCDFISGYNIKQFDIPLLFEEFSRSNIIWNPKPSIDSCIIFKTREERTLSAAHKFYCGNKFENAHDAESDVLAHISVLKGQIFRYRLNELYTQGGDYDILPCPVENILVEESKYKDEDRRLSFDGKIILNDENVAIFNFGKHKGNNVSVKSDLQYCNWLMNNAGEISSQTKNVIKMLVS